MKQVKTWQYFVILYISIVIVDITRTTIDAYCGNHYMPFGWFPELGISMGKCLIDMIFAFLVGLGVEVIIRKITEKTLIPNIITTVVIYNILALYVKSLAG